MPVRHASRVQPRSAQSDVEALPDQAGTPTGQRVLAILRKRRTDRTEPERVRELAMGALPTFERLAHGRELKITAH